MNNIIEKTGVFRSARRRRATMAWSVWLVAALFSFFQFYLQLSSGEMVSALMNTFSLTAFGGGVLVSAYYYVYVLLQAPAGMLMDRFGPRIVLSVGAAVVCMGSFLFGMAKLVDFAIVGRILMGTGGAFAFVGCLNLISRWFPMRQFAVMAAIVETIGMLGGMLGSLWLADLIDSVGWRDCMVVTGGIAGVITVLLWVIVRDQSRKKTSAASVTGLQLWDGVRVLLQNSLAWINGIYSGLMFSVVNVFIALWAIPFLVQSHQLSLLHATLVACALYIGVAIGSPVIGWLDGRFQCRRMMMIVCPLITSIFLFSVIFWTSLPLWIVSILLFFTGFFSSNYVLTFAIANEIASDNNRATSIGFTNMLCVGLAPILQPLIGLLMGHAHVLWHFEWALSVIPFSLLLAAVLGWFLPKRI